MAFRYRKASRSRYSRSYRAARKRSTSRRSYRAGSRRSNTRDVRLVIEQVAPQPAVTASDLMQGRLRGTRAATRSVF